jgi:hypothetical protein
MSRKNGQFPPRCCWGIIGVLRQKSHLVRLFFVLVLMLFVFWNLRVEFREIWNVCVRSGWLFLNSFGHGRLVQLVLPFRHNWAIFGSYIKPREEAVRTQTNRRPRRQRSIKTTLSLLEKQKANSGTRIRAFLPYHEATAFGAINILLYYSVF